MKIKFQQHWFYQLPKRIKIWGTILICCLLLPFILSFLTNEPKVKCQFYWENKELNFSFKEPLIFYSNKQYPISNNDTVYFWIKIDKLNFINEELIFAGYILGGEKSNRGFKYSVNIFESFKMPLYTNPTDQKNIIFHSIYNIYGLKFKKDI